MPQPAYSAMAYNGPTNEATLNFKVNLVLTISKLLSCKILEKRKRSENSLFIAKPNMHTIFKLKVLFL